MARLKKLKFNNTSYEFPVEDVKINTNSIVTNGVATIPVDSSVTASSTNLITSGAVSTAITGLGAGDVVGPASATSGNIAAFDGTTGKLIKDGGIATSSIVKTSGNQTIAGTKTFSTSPVVPSKTSDATNTGTAVATEAQVYKKQDTLVNQTNIKSVNGNNLLGSGNIVLFSAIQVTLAAASWSSEEITVTATGVTASNNVVISPAPSSFSDYTSAVIYCSAQASNSLTFTCTTAPTSDITVNVLIMN